MNEPVAPMASPRTKCPCCGFRTVKARGDDEIWPVCFWQDDAQDDTSADEDWGGPTLS
jgi:hypothetical protein